MRRLGWLAVLAIAASACAGRPILANDPVVRPSPPSMPAPSAAVADPVPVVLPRDDGPHQRLTEWWYYTGHLRDRETGARFGFEFVVFRAERGGFPVSWASHVALTDEAGGRFVYAQRSEVGPSVDRSPRRAGSNDEPIGFALAVSGIDPALPETFARPAWTMAGGGGSDVLSVALAPHEADLAGTPAGLAFDLHLAASKPPALHDGDGWVDFGPAGGSYYYSRTRMVADGTLVLDGRTAAVDGNGWFDHQWGDFIAVGGGGWEWFAVNLDDGTDVTLSIVRDGAGGHPLAYGTLVDPGGRAQHLGREAFAVKPTGSWTSPRTGASYPAGWWVALPGAGLAIELTPTVADQELDTRATSGVVYWEGSQRVRATRDGRPIGGQAYVELTGYAPAVAAAP